MTLATIDWIILLAYLAMTLVVGIAVSRRAGRTAADYFLSGRHMPWWLLGTSMVATTFSTDTPNLVTDIVRQNGVSGNWVWWAFLLTGMLTVFVYAKLWRRAGIMTDLEFYELRYSGRTATVLRAFRAIYLGLFFNVMIMATVTLAAIKIGGILMGLTPLQTILIAGGVTTVFCMIGGLRGVLITDFVLFITALAGSILAAVYALGHPAVGGLDALLTHPDVAGRLSILPDFTDTSQLVPLLIVPLAVQWWSVWYPGAEPGGGGYIAQRMLAARSETDATGATLLFNVAHYAVRPWPWILVALASIIVFPTVDSIQQAFPHVSPAILGHDLAYPAMLTFLPAGLLGFVVASLAAAYMSTISTHLNWGASYIVNDFWGRFIHRDAGDAELVRVGRITTVLLMILAATVALWMQNALQAFGILLQIGAGTGLLFILRWFWWRINAISELTAMIVSFVVAIYLELMHPSLFPDVVLSGTLKLVIGVGITTVAWIGVTLMTRPTDEATLRSFYALTRPGGPGWRRVLERAEAEGEPVVGTGDGWVVPQGILAMVAGCFAVYSALFAIGYWIYGRYTPALLLTIIAIAGAVYLAKAWGRVSGMHALPEEKVAAG
ncbi:MAG TPA: sodium:solute symporter family protein [Longimicrobiales bacterium]|nr:sodium:solute symporter family protein [Longimicrobiales bacterium]